MNDDFDGRLRSRLAGKGVLAALAMLVIGIPAIGVGAVSLGVLGGGSPAASIHSEDPASSPAGMVIEDVHAFVWSNGRYVSVVARITNNTGRDVPLIGGSSPVAGHVGLYATTTCHLRSAEPQPELCGKEEYSFHLVSNGEAVQMRFGDGEMILRDLRRPVTPGETIQVTFQFQGAASVTVDVKVTSSEDRYQG